MNPRFKKVLSGIAGALAIMLFIAAFSALNARKTCSAILAAELAPPPHYSTRFVWEPRGHIEEAGELSRKPGWVISYAPG